MMMSTGFNGRSSSVPDQTCDDEAARRWEHKKKEHRVHSFASSLTLRASTARESSGLSDWRVIHVGVLGV